MKLKLLFLVLATSLPCILCSQIKTNEKEQLGLRGPIKAVYRIESNKELQQPLDTTLRSSVEYYDKNGNLLSRTNYQTPGSDIVTFMMKNKYDDDNLLIESYKPLKNNEFIKTIYKYDDKQRLIEYYAYRKSSEKETDVERVQYDYSKKNQVIEAVNLHLRSGYRIVSKVDKNGNELERKRFDGDQLKEFGMHRIYQYDSAGRLVSWSPVSSKGGEYYVYNEQGDQTTVTNISTSGSASNSYYKYKYDDYNSWILRTDVTIKGTPTHYTYRVIVYY